MSLEYEFALNAAAYFSLAAGLVQWRRQRLTLPVGSVAAFQLLERSLERAFPDIKEGFTWREAISRTRNAQGGPRVGQD